MKPVQHLYNALNAMGSAIPDNPFDIRDAVIDAQDVALTLDDCQRADVMKAVTLLRARTETLDRITKAWEQSMKQIKLAIKEIESEPEAEPYGMPQ